MSTRDTRSTLASGMNGHNFIGFKMSEDLGNGLSIAGDAQFGFTLDAPDATANGAGNGQFRTITSTLALIGDHGVLVAGNRPVAPAPLGSRSTIRSAVSVSPALRRPPASVSAKPTPTTSSPG
jgi:hypothetical protein